MACLCPSSSGERVLGSSERQIFYIQRSKEKSTTQPCDGLLVRGCGMKVALTMAFTFRVRRWHRQHPVMRSLFYSGHSVLPPVQILAAPAPSALRILRDGLHRVFLDRCALVSHPQLARSWNNRSSQSWPTPRVLSIAAKVAQRMNPEPPAAGPNPTAPSRSSQAASGTPAPADDDGLLLSRGHEKPQVIPRKPNPFISANAALSLEPNELSNADGEYAIPSGSRTNRDERSEGVHLLAHQENGRVEDTPNGGFIESGRVVPAIERNRLNSLDQLPAVPSSPHPSRNTGDSFQRLTPRDRLFQVIGRVRWQIRVSLEPIQA